MAGYIGKISALVTASTADLERKLQGAKGQVNSFGSSLNRTITTAARSAQASLNDIFTPLQRIQRALSVGSNSRLGLVTPQQVEIIQRAVSVAGEINKPLAAGRKQFEALGQSVQAQFLPALDLAQRRVVGLNDLLERSGTVSEKSFAAVAARVERTTQAIQRLGEAQRIVSTGMTGNELAFFAPNVRDELTRSSQLSQKAGGLSASLLSDGAIARDVQQLANLRNEIINTQATIESGILVNADTRKAEQRLTELLAQSSRLRGSLEDRIQVNVDTKQAESAFASIQARFDAIELNRRSGATARASALEFEDATAGVMSFQRPKDERFIGRRDSTVDDEIARIRELDKEYQKLPVAAQQSLQSQIDRLNEVGNAAKNGSAGVGLLRDELAKTGAAIRKASMAESSQSLKILSQSDLRGQRISELAAQRKALAEQFRSALGGDGVGGLRVGIDEKALRSVGAQVEFVQQRLASLGSEARGPTLAALESFRRGAASLFQRGTIDTEQGRRQLELLRQQLIRTLSAAGGGNVKELTEQIGKVGRTGDIGRLGVDRAQLAIQQGLFAVDDFFSVTGDLQQRVRAIGNNVTQLGFILGESTGLFAALAAVIGTQVLVAYLKYANGGKTAADQTKALNDALSKQRDIAKEVASSIDSLTSSLLSGAFSSVAKEAQQFAEGLSEVIKKQKELRVSRIESLDVGTQANLANRNRIDRELEDETRLGRRIALLSERRRTERERQARIAGVQAAPVPTAAETAALISGITLPRRDVPAGVMDNRLREEIRAEADAGARALRLALENIAAALEGPQQNIVSGLSSQIQAIVQAQEAIDRTAQATTIVGANDQQAAAAQQQLEQLAAQEVVLRDRLAAILDRAVNDALTAGSKAAVSLGLSQAEVARAVEAGTPGALAFQKQVDALSQSLNKAFTALENANSIDDDTQRVSAVEAAKKQIDEALRLASASEQQRTAIAAVTRSLESFSSVLESVTQPADANVNAAFQAVRDARQAIFNEDNMLRRSPQQRLLNDTLLDNASRDLAGQQNLREMLALRIQQREAEAAATGGSPAVMELTQRIAEIDAALASRDTPANEQAQLLAERRRQEVALGMQQQTELLGDDEIQRIVQNIQFLSDRADAAARGREAVLTEAGRAVQSLAEARSDIEVAKSRQEITADQAARALRDKVGDAFKAGAPAIAALADAASNTRPSRAALEASDISTAEGARELNRLLRGDDPAKDANLAELRIQSKYLQELVQLAKDNNIPIADR